MIYGGGYSTAPISAAPGAFVFAELSATLGSASLSASAVAIVTADMTATLGGLTLRADATETLLPINATSPEVALELSIGGRITNIPVPIREMWSPDSCPSDKLAFLAWAFGCDEWDPNWSDDAKRQTIREAVLMQSRKGSAWAVRRVLKNAGYGTATITEGLYGRKHDGSADFDGLETYGDPRQWATYRVVLDQPITNAQAAQVRRLLEATAPARCKLQALSYVAAANIYNGAISHDGIYNHGTA